MTNNITIQQSQDIKEINTLFAEIEELEATLRVAQSLRLETNANWQTKARGTNEDEYQIYRDCADDGNGIDITTSNPLLTYEEWLTR